MGKIGFVLKDHERADEAMAVMAQAEYVKAGIKHPVTVEFEREIKEL